MKVTTKGQVTIPQEYREEFGLLPHTEVEFVREKGTLYIVKKKSSTSRGMSLVAHMKGRGGGKLTTDQIMAMTRGR